MNTQTKFTTRNGWTRETMKARIRERNNGTRSEKPYLGGRRCLYRGPNGNACAVGCFIRDEDYTSVMEDWGVSLRWIAELPTMPLLHEGLIEMQRVHDNYEGNEDMRDILCRWIDENVVDAEPQGVGA